MQSYERTKKIDLVMTMAKMVVMSVMAQTVAVSMMSSGNSCWCSEDLDGNYFLPRLSNLKYKNIFI